MSKTFKVDPFELSPDQKAARLAQAKADRLSRRERIEDEAWEAGTGPASDGRVLDAIGNWGNQRAMGDGGVLDRTASRFFEDPDANMGGLIAGAGEMIRGSRTVPTQPNPGGTIPDTPPLTLRMPR